MGRRIGWLGAVMGLCFLVLFVQLNNIQIVQAHKLATDPKNPRYVAQLNQQKYDEPEGDILASDGTVLAHSVATGATGATTHKYIRNYPQGSLYAEIVGFNSISYESTGVEASYGSFLQTHSAPIKSVRDLLVTRSLTDAVTLTVVPKIQQAAVAALGSKTGAIVVLNPSTGAILGMYSTPTFDPNPLAALNLDTEKAAWTADNTTNPSYEPFQKLAPLNGLNMAYQDSWPPGSTMKTITASAAYDHDPSLVTKSYPQLGCIPPAIPAGQPPPVLPETTKPLCNFGIQYPSPPNSGCGGAIAAMLPPSCDTGFALVGLDLGAQKLNAEATSFGFNQQPPIDLPHSTFQVSIFPTQKTLEQNIPFQAYSAIGQEDVQATPLQMALVASAFANRGVIMTPHVMAEIDDSDGNVVSKYSPAQWLRATSPATAAALTGLMQSVVTGGTANPVGFNPADNVAAKTGTAQTGHGTIDAWMIAFAPANNPKVAVAVVIPDSPLDQTGAQYAGPVMRQMITAALGQ